MNEKKKWIYWCGRTADEDGIEVNQFKIYKDNNNMMSLINDAYYLHSGFFCFFFLRMKYEFINEKYEIYEPLRFLTIRFISIWHLSYPTHTHIAGNSTNRLKRFKSMMTWRNVSLLQEKNYQRIQQQFRFSSWDFYENQEIIVAHQNNNSLRPNTRNNRFEMLVKLIN